MRLVVAVEAASDALCRGAVVGMDISFESGTFRQSGQVVEDLTAAVVDEEDAQRTIELRVPKRVGIVEEGEIAEDAKHFLAAVSPLPSEGKACCHRE